MHLVRWEQPHRVAQRLPLSGPMVRRSTGLEDDRCRGLLREEWQEPFASETPFLIDAAWSMGDGDLKHRLCEIDSDGRMLQGDSSLLWPSRGRFTWHDDAASAGGVHSIACRRRRSVPL